MKKWIARGLGTLLLFYLAILLVLYFSQENMVFNTPSAFWRGGYDFPQGTETFTLSRPDGAELAGVMLPALSDGPEIGVIAFYKGNAWNNSALSWMSKSFRQMGYCIYAIDYRGYGLSTGEKSETVMLEDAVALFDHAARQNPGHAVRVVGYSLGTTFASHVAARRDVGDVILFAPMKSVVSLATDRFPFIPSFILRFPLRSDAKLKAAQMTRFIIFHGKEDRVVPFASGKALFDGAENGDDKFVAYEDLDHFRIVDDPRVHEAIAELWTANVLNPRENP